MYYVPRSSSTFCLDAKSSKKIKAGANPPGALPGQRTSTSLKGQEGACCYSMHKWPNSIVQTQRIEGLVLFGNTAGAAFSPGRLTAERNRRQPGLNEAPNHTL